MYKIKKGAIPFLEDNGFKQLYDGTYRLRFPVYFYRRIPTIFCNAYIYLEESREIRLEVEKNGHPYYPWYENNMVQCAKVLKEIDKNINDKMHKIGARCYGYR